MLDKHDWDYWGFRGLRGRGTHFPDMSRWRKLPLMVCWKHRRVNVGQMSVPQRGSVSGLLIAAASAW